MSSSLIDVIRLHAPAPTGRVEVSGGGDRNGLLAALARVPDPRDRRGIHYPLASVLAVAVCAVLAGASTFAAIGTGRTTLTSRRGLGSGSPAGFRCCPRCGGSSCASTPRRCRRC
jgi:hypothetical protein